MDVRFIFLSQLLLFLLVKSSRALSCSPCETYDCPEIHCAGGTALHPCGCCSACAKQKGDPCGGLYGLAGTCDKGLLCLTSPVPDGELQVDGVCVDYSDMAFSPVPSSATPDHK